MWGSREVGGPGRIEPRGNYGCDVLEKTPFSKKILKRYEETMILGVIIIY